MGVFRSFTFNVTIDMIDLNLSPWSLHPNDFCGIYFFFLFLGFFKLQSFNDFMLYTLMA